MSEPTLADALEALVAQAGRHLTGCTCMVCRAAGGDPKATIQWFANHYPHTPTNHQTTHTGGLHAQAES